MANEATGALAEAIGLLRLAGVGQGGALDDGFLHDALWLAGFVRESEAAEPDWAARRLGGETAEKDSDRKKAATDSRLGQSRETGSGGDATGDGQTGLYPRPPVAFGGPGVSASPVYIPESGALPEPLAMTRALRPFRRRFRAGRFGELDEAGTADLSAERRMPTPKFRPRTERWFSLALLVDDAPSMAVWRSTAGDLARFLGGLGVFRDVRTWRFGTVGGKLRLTSGGVEAAARQIADPAGRTLIVVMTNGVGPHWKTAEWAEALGDWARQTPVAICQMLPPARWRHTQMGAATLWTRAGSAGAPNGLLTVGEGPRLVAPEAGVTVYPVFPLSAEGLARWAAMQMAVRETRMAAAPMSPAWLGAARPAGPTAAPTKKDVERRVVEFLNFASEDAGRLMGYLAAVPLSLPLMRLVLRAMLPGAPLSALAEVSMSGLLTPLALSNGRWDEPGGDPEEALFRFDPAARAYLRERMNILDLDKIWRTVKDTLTESIARRAGAIGKIETWVADRSGTGVLPPELEEFARVTYDTLRALGYYRLGEEAAAASGANPSGPTRPPRVAPVPVYLSYSRLDMEWVRLVQAGLKPLEDGGLIAVLAGRGFRAGRRDREERECLTRVASARVIVVLQSENYRDSAYCRDRELPLIEKRVGNPAVLYLAGRRDPKDMAEAVSETVEEVREAAHGLNAGTQWVNPADGLTYVWCPPGRFRMGASEGDEEAYGDEKPAREVVIEKGFWIGETPVTQRAYEKVMGKNPSYFKGLDRPVERVSWHEAAAYAAKVGMRLPTEAEWEYAARAGSKEARYGPVDEIAWYRENSGNETHEVGKKKANGWGLHDMLGNVWEWTGTLYDNSQYALRGGSCDNDAWYARVSFRYGNGPDNQSLSIGFRCVGESASL